MTNTYLYFLKKSRQEPRQTCLRKAVICPTLLDDIQLNSGGIDLISAGLVGGIDNT
jgi:hypothetical protein